jgi:hypothetical protein
VGNRHPSPLARPQSNSAAAFPMISSGSLPNSRQAAAFTARTRASGPHNHAFAQVFEQSIVVIIRVMHIFLAG